jgi:hypothetical protein
MGTLARRCGGGSCDGCSRTLSLAILVLVLILMWLRRGLLHSRIHGRGIAVRIIRRIMIAIVVLLLGQSRRGVDRLLIREIRTILFLMLEERHRDKFSLSQFWISI